MNECYVFQNAPLGHPDTSAQKAVLAMNSPTRPHVTPVASRTRFLAQSPHSSGNTWGSRYPVLTTLT